MRHIYAFDILSAINVRDYPLIGDIIQAYSLENVVMHRDDKSTWESIYCRSTSPFDADIHTMGSTYVMMCAYVVLKSQGLPVTIHPVSGLDFDYESIYIKYNGDTISCFTEDEIDSLQIEWGGTSLTSGDNITASDLSYMYHGDRQDIVECNPVLEGSSRQRCGYARMNTSRVFNEVLTHY